ncbi:MAG TPA: glycoside hydrolase family 32 protein, partial [Cyclobacteriaceae bacterium]
EYHLFYQYNPYGDTWGHMSWGHTVSKDLLHWEQLPVAIEEYPDPATGDSTMIFSGTVVVDKNNSSGLCSGKECMVAIYTSHVHKDGEGKRQHQSLAYSNDKGRAWKRYDKNPILDIQLKDFRDPKVFWYEPQEKWVMVLVIPDQFKAQFYESKNLTQWNKMSEFGPMGDTLKIWECPDIYELPIEGTDQKKWILSLSNSHPQGPKFVGMQYFVGQFDGTKFTPDDLNQKPLYVDYGKDFYAGITFNNMPKEDNRTILLGWANNWTYGNKIPTSPWRSAMSLPRELTLKGTTEGIRLNQRPIHALTSLRGKELKADEIAGKQLELEIEIDVAGAEEVGVRVLKSGEEETIIGYDAVKEELFLDRTRSGNVTFHPDFPSIERVKLKPINGKINLHIFIDHSLIEVFANNGEQVISDQVFPTKDDAKVETYSKDGAPKIAMKGWRLNE